MLEKGKQIEYNQGGSLIVQWAKWAFMERQKNENKRNPLSTP